MINTMTTINVAQENYAVAKAWLETLKSEIDDAEADYIKSRGITNQDGSTPTHTWRIDDDDLAERAINEFGSAMNNSELWADYLQAEEACKVAEDDLISFTLALIPDDKARIVLEREAARNVTVREKIVKMAFALDASTIPA